MGDAADLIVTIADVLRTALPEQRWFAGKGRPVYGVAPMRATVLGGTDPQLVHAVVEVDQGEPHRDRYQLLLGVRSDLPEALGHAWVAPAGERAVYQAVHDPDLTAMLLTLLAEGAEVDGVRFATEPGVELDTGLRSRPVTGEQSNTSLVYGQTYILKLFRKLGAGRSPDLELHRALATVGCQHIAQPLGSIEGELGSTGSDISGDPDADQVTYGMLTEYLRGTADGWAMATASVRDLLAEDLLANGALAYPHPEDVGGDFAAEAYRLGQAVATVHADLATALSSSPAPPGYLHHLADRMYRSLDTALTQLPELAPYEAGLRSSYDAIRGLTGPVSIQRIHGDLHLGQVLRSVTGWVLIDFEGEPMVPLAERTAPASPLRDVAGMLRSFDYAAHHLAAHHTVAPPLAPHHMQLGESDSEKRAAVAMEWATRNRDAFCDGYAHVASDPREQAVLLRAFELDKAVYEISYEHQNRPPWRPIPLAAIARLTGQASPES